MKLKIFLILLCVLVASPLYAEQGIVAEINLKGIKGIDINLVREVIPIKKGDVFSYEEIETSINYLRKWGVFNTIEARTENTDKGIVIEFIFRMANIITRIDIDGNYPYLENKIRKYLTLNTGNIYTPKRVEDQIDRIKQFYDKQGFIGTEVYVEEEEEPSKQGIALIFHIKRGGVLRYRNIEILDNKAYPDGRFISAINTWKPFSEKKLRNSIRTLTEFYQKNGYPKVKIRIKEKKFNFDENFVDLVLAVREGPHVKVAFEGNSKISSRKLKQTVTIFKEGSYDSYEIDISEDNIKKLYKEYGYPETKIKTKKINLAEDNILIIFTIKEGKSQIIKRIDFKGNESISSGNLRNALVSKQKSFGTKGALDPALAAEDKEAIEQEYKKEGFLNTEVEDFKINPTKQGFQLNIEIPIKEGLQTRVNKVVLNGNKSVENKTLLEGLEVKKDKPLDLIALPEDKQKIINYYSNNGYPYAEVDQQIIYTPDKTKAEIIYNITENNEVKIGRILIVGDVLTSQKAIKRAMGIGENDLFSYKKIVESRLNLRRLGAFSAVKVEPVGLQEKQDSVHLVVQVDEQRPFLVDLGLGYSTDQNITGFLEFKNLNSFGWAKHTSFKLTAGQELARAELGWLDPRFLGSSFEMSVNPWLQYVKRPAFNYIQAAGSLGFFRRYRSWGFLFRYELDRNYFIEGSSTSADSESLRNNTISKISLSSSYDTRDSFSNPKKGWFTLGGVDIFNEIRGNQANFVKFTWQGENEFTILKRITFSSSIRVNRIQTIGENISVPSNELLFLGGDDTIRGFNEDSLGPLDANADATGARTRGILNEEIRLHIWDKFYLALFYDMGALTRDFSDINLATIRNSAGFGLRYITPVGPIRFDYGIKLDKEPNESFGRFHLTFGYMF